MSSLLLFLLLTLPASQDKGGLLIQTEPGTEVIWDGVTLAKTDTKGRLSIEEIPLGEYTLVLRKEGFRALQRDVDVQAGQISLVLPLERIPESRSVTAPKTAPKAAKTPKPSPAPAKPQQVEARKPVLPPEFKVTEKGDVPVWPNSQQQQDPERSATGNAFFWLFLFCAAAAAAVMAMLRRRPRAELPEPAPTLLPTDLGEEPAEEEEEESVNERPVSFLNELKMREELLEQGVEIVKTDKGKRTIIDLDASNVREVEDKP